MLTWFSSAEGLLCGESFTNRPSRFNPLDPVVKDQSDALASVDILPPRLRKRGKGMTERGSEKKKDSGMVRLKLGPGSWPVDNFDPSIEGVPILKFGEYTDVPAGQEQAVRDQAKANGLTIGKEG